MVELVNGPFLPCLILLQHYYELELLPLFQLAHQLVLELLVVLHILLLHLLLALLFLLTFYLVDTLDELQYLLLLVHFVEFVDLEEVERGVFVTEYLELVVLVVQIDVAIVVDGTLDMEVVGTLGRRTGSTHSGL